MDQNNERTESYENESFENKHESYENKHESEFNTFVQSFFKGFVVDDDSISRAQQNVDSIRDEKNRYFMSLVLKTMKTNIDTEKKYKSSVDKIVEELANCRTSLDQNKDTLSVEQMILLIENMFDQNVSDADVHSLFGQVIDLRRIQTARDRLQHMNVGEDVRTALKVSLDKMEQILNDQDRILGLIDRNTKPGEILNDLKMKNRYPESKMVDIGGFKFEEYDVRGDGNCFWYSVATALFYDVDILKKIYRTIEGKDVSLYKVLNDSYEEFKLSKDYTTVKQNEPGFSKFDSTFLRWMVSNYVRQPKTEEESHNLRMGLFGKLSDERRSGPELNLDEITIDDVIKHVEKDGCWAGNLEVMALQSSLKNLVNIQVKSDSSSFNFGGMKREEYPSAIVIHHVRNVHFRALRLKDGDRSQFVILREDPAFTMFE